MKRYLEPFIQHDLPNKIVMMMGPRQCGKTTLAKYLCPDYQYLNYDALSDRAILHEQAWDRQKTLVLFDELHKMPEWKRWLKGIYDTEGLSPQLLVTGSANLNAYKRVGDSLAGRYFSFQLHLLDLKEIMTLQGGDLIENFNTLLNCSGFPEPFLKGTEAYYKRWRTTHLDIILRQDLIDLYTIQDLNAIQNLILLLKNRVGSSVSYTNLARDLQKDVNTIKRWLLILEDLYIIYRVTPYSEKIARSLIKEPKFYFYDHNYANNQTGARLENLVSNALLKELHFIRDTTGSAVSLHYLRTKDGKELDFLICIDDKPTRMLEIKNTDATPLKAFQHFQSFLPNTQMLQLVKTLEREKTYPNGLVVRKLIPWLANMDLNETQH